MDRSWPCNGYLEDGISCSQLLTADTKFCPECGTKNKPPDKTKPNNDYRELCPQRLANGQVCGKEMPSGDTSCSSCATSARQKAATAIPKQKSTATKTRDQWKASQQRDDGKRRRDAVTVEFYALLDPDFKYERKSGHVYITFDAHQLGHWQVLPEHELTQLRQIEGGTFIKGEVQIPTELLAMGRSLQYKYCIVREGSNDKMWENILQDANRNLNLEMEAVPSGVIHRYDGIILRKPESWYSKVGQRIYTGSTFSDKKATKNAIEEILPFWEGCGEWNRSFSPVTTARAVVERISHLFKVTKDWPVCTEMKLVDRRSCFKEVLESYVRECPCFKNRPQSQKEASLQMASAMMVVMLTQEYGLNIELNHRLLILSALQVQPDQKQRVCHAYNELLTRHFPGQKQVLAAKLQLFIKNHVSNAKTDWHWLKAIPLWHFLEGASQPFQSPEIIYSRQHTDAKWWGVAKIDGAVDTFKKSFLGQGILIQMLNALIPLYDVDVLLPRTILASLGHRSIPTVVDLGNMPPEALLAMMYYHIKVGNITMKESMPRLKKVVARMSDVQSDPTYQIKAGHDVAFSICVDIIDIVIAMPAVEYSLPVDMVELALSVAKIGKSERTWETLLMSKLNNWLRQWLPINMMITKTTPGSLVDKDEIDVWSRLLHINFGDSTSSWRKDCLTQLKTRLTMLRPGDMLDIYQHQIKFDSHNKELIDCINEMAFEAAEKHLRDGGHFSMEEGAHVMVWSLFSNVFMRIWPKVEGKPTHDPREVLAHILTLQDFKRYLQLLKSEEASQTLTEECGECLQMAESILYKVVTDVVSGDIPLGQLRYVTENSQAFIENAEAAKAWNPETMNRDVLKELIDWREKELCAVDAYKQRVNALRSICNTMNSVDTSDLDKKLSSIDGNCTNLSDICDNVKYDPETSQFDKDKPQAKISFFGWSADIENKLDSLLKLERSDTFLMILTKVGSKCIQQRSQDATEPLLSVEQLFDEVWPKAEEKWNKLSQSVIDGTMRLKVVQNIFRGYHQRLAKVREELGYMFTKENVPRIQERLQQIQRYFQLSRYAHGAKVIMDARNSLCLTGDFSMIETIHDTTNSAQLGSITEEVENIGKVLEGMTDSHTKCIEAYIKSQPLVVWLKDHIKRIQELKAFVDLALISATGKDDFEVTKVSCLHAAVSGYAPLIYDLEDTAGFDEFYAKCQAVWDVQSADHNLPQKLIDLHHQLEWLKAVNEAQGDVEVNALKQVSAINSRGIYIVGQSGNSSQSKTVEDVIRVIVLPSNQETDQGEEKVKRVYTLTELTELQSKLMLVAGKAEKGNKDVDSFVEKFDGITGLANSFVNICSAGNILFKTWTAKFYCDPSRKNNAVIDFGLSEHKLSGSNKDTDVTQQIHQIRLFIDSCLEEWKCYIEEERAKYPELNHYTTEQLVILRGELARLYNGEDAGSERVLALLQDVHPDCIVKHVMAACREVAKEQRLDEGQVEGSGSPTDELSEEDAVRFKDLVEVYGVACVVEAIKQLGDVDIDDIESKCVDLEDEERERQTDAETVPDQEEVDIAVLQDEQTMKDMTGLFLQQLSEQKSNLREKLDKLWENVHTSSAKSMADYLSIEHLGRILQHLTDSTPINRPLPAYLKKGQPNLIVCSASDALSTAVAMYMEDETLHLPTRNEVLLCDENTSSEQVELLIRRAVSDQTGRIFLIVNIEMLSYEVAAQVEKAIEMYTQGHADYKLAVICSSELQDTSHLVTALDNYRVHTPARPPLERLRAYLQKHLQGNDDTIPSACQVDPEKCCVRVVRSDRSGIGKTLWMNRRQEELLKKFPPEGDAECHVLSLPLYGKAANVNRVLEMLLPHTQSPEYHLPSLYHINIPHEMQHGVDHLLFNLIILGSLTDPLGYTWQRSSRDLYVLEIMPLLYWEVGQNDTDNKGQNSVHHCLELLPTVMCRSPQECLVVLQRQDKIQSHDQYMDLGEFRSERFQRVFQYLSQLHKNPGTKNLHSANPKVTQGTPMECLNILLGYCGLHDPSWAELIQFIRFLDIQLQSCENSCFPAQNDVFPGFMKFIVRFMIQMSKDFSTRSLNIAEESHTPGTGAAAQPQVSEAIDEELEQFQLKRHWETSPHPYIFFNPDGITMTFLGFVIQRPNFDVVDAQTKTVLEEKIMDKSLFDGLVLNRANLSENFDALLRESKIEKMCMVMGNDHPHDPDSQYVLTADNVKKILAIQMRFRCNIPVVIMGETGCGKTELIKFMCRLQCPKGKNIKNMLLMKVHGGTTEADLVKKVQEGEKLAASNQKDYPNMHTVLFLDEVNTTEALGLVKEVLCDRTLNGVPLPATSSLRLIAACNPYRKHSREVIEKLEHAGLGYHVKADKTTDKLGRIPMRHLVYRVQPLPQSLLPLVWDFGQLRPDIEKLYIEQIVKKKLSASIFQDVNQSTANIITNILVAAQTFMRNQQNECSFVSLRDVNRAMDVMAWFYHQRDTLFTMMDEQKAQQEKQATVGLLDEAEEDDSNESTSKNEDTTVKPPSKVARSLILALGVCYHAGLQEKRTEFRDQVGEQFTGDLTLLAGPDTIEQEISLCQDVFLNGIKLGPNIARNQALKENVFMMLVCIELRIPLFLVGKPGSSKSLAKTIVMDAMQGPNSQSELFKKMKQVYMVSYQCSQLSTPDGIMSIFGQCAQLQKDKEDVDKFVAVVVLDEIGLAEDSPQMPLKTLHPLLEDGCATDDEQDERYKKVGFVGISNWALDPAKMNRGILVQRAPPDISELERTAKDICSSEEISQHINRLMHPLAKAYMELYDEACLTHEFYGLRDFYSLVKMVNGFVRKNNEIPTWNQLKHAILRNFGGLDSVQPLEVFYKYLQGIARDTIDTVDDPDNSPAGLLRASLNGGTIDGESRYLLVLTENYAALQILQQNLDAMRNAIIIFGSSFPKDQEYVVVCRNINRIKICMETGQTVVLLNQKGLYESLYDALNQYYTYFGGQRHVDLGLGSHRVKARVHQDFKLIVVAEKEVVYKEFPIPLINRLEKHFVAKSTMLTAQQQRIVRRLSDWSDVLSDKLSPSDVFMGYHSDACATVVLHVCYQVGNEGDETWADKVYHIARELLLQCATPEAIIRSMKPQLRTDGKSLMDVYFTKQQHNSLMDYLRVQLNNTGLEPEFIQVTTHSRLLSNKDMADVARVVGLPPTAVHSQVLHAFNTEQQFYNLLRGYFNMPSATDQVLIIQCDSGDKSGDLIACARYMIREEFNQARWNREDQSLQTKRHIVIIVQLPRVTGGCFIGFQGGMWKSVHLDDLRPQQYQMHSFNALRNMPISVLLRSAIESRLRCSHEPKELNARADATKIEDGAQIVSPTQTFYNQLLRLCVHGAVALLRDKATVVNSTARIHILLSLLQETQQEPTDSAQQRFADILEHRIQLLMKDKEDTQMGGTMASDWLIKDVASADAINNAGTLRRSLWNYLEKKITPILAGLIAYVDTNNNLAIVAGDNWKQRMWLSVFMDAQLSPMAYRDLVSTEQATWFVEMKGMDGTTMNGQLPFSWLLKDYVDDLINKKKKERAGQNDVSRSVGHVLKQSPWWPVLEAAFEDAGVDSIFECYLDDFVRMVYKPRTENVLDEYTVLKRALSAIVYQLEEKEKMEKEEQLGVEHLIPMVHVAKAEIHGRIEIFADVLTQHPAILQDVQQFNDPDDPLSSHSEVSLDVLAVRFVVKSIQPERRELRDPKRSREWMNRVEMTSPLVNTILARANSLRTGGLGSYSQACLGALVGIECEWNRVSTVKLFVETICPAGSDQEKNATKYGPMLFTRLEGADFKTEKTMKSVEDFLQFVTKEASKKYLGEVKDCPSCKEKMMVSVIMPCEHEVCEDCLKDLVDAEDFSCYTCKVQYNKEQELERLPLCDREQLQKLQHFKQRCNTFLTEVFSRMCFAGTTPPEDEVIAMLMGYVTKKRGQDKSRPGTKAHAGTKAMNLFNDNLDPTPIIRSVLLQLLLRSSIDKVSGHLKEYFKQAHEHVKESKDIIELAILYIQCLEDHYYNAASTGTEKDRAISARNHLMSVLDDLKSDQVTQLSGIAKARFGLSLAAEWMIRVYVRQQTPFDMAVIDALINAAQDVCTKEEHPGPSLFLMRQIARRYSLSELHQAADIFPWVIPDYAKPDETDTNTNTAPDHFVVYGARYKALRNTMNEALVLDSMGPFTAALKEGDTEEAAVDERQDCTNTLLAVYREVTSKYILSDPDKQLQHQVIEALLEACEDVDVLKEQSDLLHSLAQNTVATQCPQLKVSPATTNQDMALLEVILHFIVASSTGFKNLLKPMRNLIEDPATMKSSFIPTMPGDRLYELLAAALVGNQYGEDINKRLCECPNGHLYLIGDCGGSNEISNCNECGASIGGTGGQELQAGNKRLTREDQTKPGHSLGSPENRPNAVEPERGMSPACTALTRLLVHLSLYIGANKKLQGVHALITPSIEETDVPDFLWQHLKTDLDHISRATGKGMDDTLVLIHLFIQNLKLNGNDSQTKELLLTTKEARSKWETTFAGEVVTPFLKNLDEQLTGAQDAITNDERQSNNSLRRYIHESEKQGADVDVANHLDRAPAIWRYRTRVSIEHLTQELGENMAAHGGEDQQNLQQYQVLHLFLKKEPLLRVVRLIPDILRFITMLTERYHRRIDRAEADELTIRHFLEMHIRNDKQREEAETLFNHFVTAWTAVHTYLHTHLVSGQVLPEEQCYQKITCETPLSTFLPSLRGRGLCTVSLLHYLSSMHNHFMDDYCRITRTSARPSVSFRDLTPAHIITYDPERDLLPMVLANCTYSLEVGHGTRVEYNYRSLEQQLMERFIKGKAPITFQLQNISYREELNNATLFKTLQTKIPQEPLSPAVRDKIRGDCQNMMEITDCLSSLDIAIGFLVSVGGNPDSSLIDFMTNTLQMDPFALRNMTGHHCKLCHSQALWLLLSHEREKLAARHKHEPFTSVDVGDYHVKLTEEEKEDLQQALTHVDVDSFLAELYECILLHFTIKDDPNDKHPVIKRLQELNQILYVYIEDKDEMPMAALTNGVFLKGIKAEKCVDVWCVAFAYHEANIGAARRF